jgi:hypothetical protein
MVFIVITILAYEAPLPEMHKSRVEWGLISHLQPRVLQF